MARTGTKGTRIDGFLLLRVVYHPFGPNAEECSEVSLVQMDYTQPMDFEVATFFWNGGCHNGLPSVERVSSVGTEVEKS